MTTTPNPPVSRHCGTCEHWNAADKPTTRDGHCEHEDHKGCTFLVMGCWDWEERANLIRCPECGQEFCNCDPY